MSRVLLALLCLTLFATSAAAECAWVLWISAVGPASVFNTMDAFPSSQECKEALYSAALTKIIADAKREGTSLVPICLPDTVDPRGAKGGGR